MENFQLGIVELHDLDDACIAQRAQRFRIVGVEVRQRARVFGRGCILDQPTIASREPVP